MGRGREFELAIRDLLPTGLAAAVSSLVEAAHGTFHLIQVGLEPGEGSLVVLSHSSDASLGVQWLP